MRRRTLPAWLAILAIALQALWPLLAQARPAAPGHLVPLCSVDGVTHYVEIPGAKPPVEQRSSSFHEHCKLCVFGAERLEAPPQMRLAPATLALAPAPAEVFPAARFESPAAARAPPLS